VIVSFHTTASAPRIVGECPRIPVSLWRNESEL
jgi:hypothetical protein